MVVNQIEFISRTLKFIIGVPGNLLIVYYFFTRCCYRKTSFNLFVSLMALSDLLVCLLRETNVLMRLFYVDKSIANFSCRFMYEIPFIAADASLWILCGLSFDRYRKITKPLQKQLCKSQILTICLTPFFLSFVVYYTYIDSHKIDTTNQHCVKYRRINLIEQIFSGIGYIVLFTLIPVVTIVSCYRLTSRFIKQQSVLDDNDPQKKLEYERNKNALATMKPLPIIMVSTVALPRIILASYYGINIIYKGLRDETYFPIIQCLVYSILFANNTINVFVYMRHVQTFKKFVISHVCCFWCTKSEKQISRVAGKFNYTCDDDGNCAYVRKPRNNTNSSILSVELPLNEKC